MILEACVETVEEAVRAERNGAHQIELCSRLELDGLTPSAELVKAVQSKCKLPIHAMVRPREGNFVYSEAEIKQMLESIEMFHKLKVAGVVFGMFNSSNEIHLDQLRRLVQAAKPLTITFHKAIDHAVNPLESFQTLDDSKLIDQVLTSGGMPTAEEGISVLTEMCVSAKNSKVKIAGKVTQKNIELLATKTGAKLFHGRKIV